MKTSKRFSSKSILILNVTPSIKKIQIRNLLLRHGMIQKIAMVPMRNKSWLRMAFVQFEYNYSMISALKQNHLRLQNVSLPIRRAYYNNIPQASSNVNNDLHSTVDNEVHTLSDDVNNLDLNDSSNDYEDDVLALHANEMDLMDVDIESNHVLNCDCNECVTNKLKLINDRLDELNVLIGKLDYIKDRVLLQKLISLKRDFKFFLKML